MTLPLVWEQGFKSGWGYFVTCRQTLKSWLYHRKKSDSICCQLWPRIPRFCHRDGNLLSTTRNRTDATTNKNTAVPADDGALVSRIRPARPSSKTSPTSDVDPRSPVHFHNPQPLANPEKELY